MRVATEGARPTLIVERAPQWFESTPLCLAWREWARVVARRYGRDAGERTNQACSVSGAVITAKIEDGTIAAGLGRRLSGSSYSGPHYTGVRKGVYL